jgi:hypothetical protein
VQPEGVTEKERLAVFLPWERQVQCAREDSKATITAMSHRWETATIENLRGTELVPRFVSGDLNGTYVDEFVVCCRIRMG